jgi:hypothetical protein
MEIGDEMTTTQEQQTLVYSLDISTSYVVRLDTGDVGGGLKVFRAGAIRNEEM